MANSSALLASTAAGCWPHQLDRDEAASLSTETDTAALMTTAAALRDAGHGDVVTYSRKVFIPLTRLCRDVCHYCTFAAPPRRGEAAYMTPDEVLAVARAGSAQGCKEALFTLGDKPELRYRAARDELVALGHGTTISYLAQMMRLVFEETGLLPHPNPGVMSAGDIAALRRGSISQGLMLESTAPGLSRKGGAHHGSPDKDPARRLETVRLAGAAGVPFTSGILIGIGETRLERIEALLALRDLDDRYGHIQEIIVQNFRAKPGTRMAQAPEPALDELLWTIAVARLLFGAEANIQAPPNLSPGALGRLVDAGINDWGGVSPVTPDHVNPEAPWPHLDGLAQQTAAAGKVLTERLTLYPAYARNPERWLDGALRGRVLQATDAEGYARTGEWCAGADVLVPEILSPAVPSSGNIGNNAILERILGRALGGVELGEGEIVRLFQARGEAFAAVIEAADGLRAQVKGDTVTYVVNRNINYTNVCYFKCRFCAFSKGRPGDNLRGRPYDLGIEEIERRGREAWARGATELCLQGGIHPDYDGDTYVDICRRLKRALPGMHLHAFSPLEVWQGAKTLGVVLPEFLARLADAGLGTLPGTAAEILDDEVRAVICPDKLTTRQWVEVMETVHGTGFRTTATIMFGHVEGPEHWARHLLHVRRLQARTGGFTEFVPLPFVAMEAPLYRKGGARRGPTFREAVLMHAVARLALHPLIPNIQASWTKLGPDGAAACLLAGVNDLGGTLMNESITRAAGAAHGQEMAPKRMEALIRAAGRVPMQRTTAYAEASAERVAASRDAPPLTPPVNTPLSEDTRRASRRPARDLVRPGLEVEAAGPPAYFE
ncbi:MAG TPA: 5-amino-6-(D-ribitylamino)uracil--L-tyrosine 4-hydroxyphenyl transferase CofH [Rhodospirillales bacterium]|nr:5-amino-6-(D-ribitylamino)uracil--L-tyrosine 4-hydroxyphenyl transferase CofH [Rhodospirillales bacterium]